MKYTTLLLSGVPRKVKLVELSYCLNQLFYTDDEIGSFALRDLPNDGQIRQIALDFRSGFDAIAAQARLDSYHYKLPDGEQYTLCAKITWKEEFMRQQTSSPEPWREEGSEMGAEEPWPMALVPTVSDGAIYQANAKLDAQLELLKKQKLILRTERKLLKQKRKLKNEYASMCDEDSDDQPTTSKRRRNSRARSPATPEPQDLQISSSGPKDPMPKLKALMSVEESKSTNLKRKTSRQKESRSRSKDRSPDSRDKDVNNQMSQLNAFDPMDRISMSKRSVIDYRSKSPERSPQDRKLSRWDEKYTRCSRSTRSRSRERLVSYRSRSRERLASYRSRSRERLASNISRSRARPVSYRSRSPERDPTRKINRPLAIMPKSPEIIRSPRIRRVSLTKTRQTKEATMTKYNSDANITMKKDTSAIEEKTTSSIELSAIKEEATSSKDLSAIDEDATSSKELSAIKEKATTGKELSAIKEKATSSKELSAIKEKATTSRDLSAIKEKATTSKDLSTINEKATSSKELSAIKEKATTSKDLSAIKEKATSCKELSASREKITSSKELCASREKGTSSKELSAIKEKVTMGTDRSAIKWEATSSKELSAIKEKATTSKNLSAIKEKATLGKKLSAIREIATSSKELSAIKEKATTSKDLSAIKVTATSSKELSAIKEKATTSKDLSAIKVTAPLRKELSAIREKATSSKELSAIKEKVTMSKDLSASKDKATSSKELSAIKEKATTSKDLSAIKEKATSSKGLSAIKEKTTSSKNLSAIKEKATSSKELSTIKEKATSRKELSAIKEKATTSKNLSAIKEAATLRKELSAIKEKATTSKDLSAIKEKATLGKKLSAIREKTTSSKELGAIKEKASLSKELSAIKKKATSSKELRAIKEKATTSKDLSTIKEKATSSKELSAIKEKATLSKELSAIKGKATSSKELSAIKEKATSSKYLSAIVEKATSSKELSAIKEKATPSNIVASKYTNIMTGSNTPNKNKTVKDLSANEEIATKSSVLVSKYAHTKVATEKPVKNTSHEELSKNYEKTTRSNVLDSEYSRAKIGSETLDKSIERTGNIGNVIMRLMYNILEEISLEEKRELSENQKAQIDGILSAHVLNRIKPLMAAKNVTEEQAALNYRKLYSKEEDTKLISELLEGIPKETCKKDDDNDDVILIENKCDAIVLDSDSERGDSTATTDLVSNSSRYLPVKTENHYDFSADVTDNIEINTISEATDRCSDPGLSIISWFTTFMENQHVDQSRHKNITKKCTEKTPVPEKINKQNINNLLITEVIDVDDDDEDSQIKNQVEKTASNNLTITEKTEIKDTEADNKVIIIKDETKSFKAKSKRVTKTAFIDVTFDKDFCPIPARPQFVLVLKKLLKQMKNTIETADKKGLREFPISMFKSALKSMLRKLIAGKGYLGTCEIIKLFRAKYPKEEDYVLINQVIQDIKMGKYGKYTEAGQPEDKDDDKDDVILIENKCDVVIVLDSDDDVDQISEKPNLDVVKPTKRELQNTQHVEAEPTLQSQHQCNIVKADPNDYPATVVKETSQINKVTGSNVSAAYLPINDIDREKADKTSSGLLNCTEEPVENIKQEIESEFTDAAVENLLDSLKSFDSLDYINDTEKETPQVTAITIMTSFSELISLKNEINQSSDKDGNISTDIEASEIKIENDLILNTMIKTECVPDDKQYGHESAPVKGRDNNDCNKVIRDRAVGKPNNESGPTVVDGYVACSTKAKTVSREDDEESIESITKFLLSLRN